MNSKSMMMKSLFAIATVLSLVACGKSSSDNRSSTRSTDANAQAVASNISKCFNGSNGVGYVYSNSGDLTENVRQLVSATMNPGEFGEVSGTPHASTGIDMRLRVRRNGQQVVLAETQLQLTIIDSNVGQVSGTNGTVQPYTITMYKATNAQYSGNSLLIDFADQFGVIKVNLAVSGQTAYGDIQFVNNTNTQGGGGYSGSLGNFVIPACVIQGL